MDREREIARVRQTPTENLFGQLILSIFNKNWHFNEFQWKELAYRMGRGIPKITFGASNTLIDASRGVGQVAMSGFR